MQTKIVNTYACKKAIAISNPVISSIINVGNTNNKEVKPKEPNIIQENSDKIFNKV